MILDSSAIVAILTQEASGPRLLDAALGAARLHISAATALEVSIVLDNRHAPQQRRRLDDLLHLLGAEVVPFDEEQWRVARQAYQDFGRGSGHPARLNMGDCFAYALHRVTGEPLLYVGDDFSAAGVPRVTD